MNLATDLAIKPISTGNSDLIATYSGLGKFSACPRLWYLSEYLGLRKKKEPIIGPLPFGSRIHKAIELWLHGYFESPVDIWNQLMATEYANAQQLGWDEKDLDKESKLGNRMLDTFPIWLEEQAFWARYEPVSIETAMSETITLPIKVDGAEQMVQVLIRGKSDMIVRRVMDGKYLILDWKTTQALAESVLSVMAKSPQTRLYRVLAKQTHPEYDFYGSLVVFLRKVMQTASAKPPFYGELEIELPPADLQAYRTRMIGATSALATVKKRLDEGADPNEVAYFDPSRVNCMSCPFRQPCDLLNSYPAGGVDMLHNEYVQSDPFARYAGPDNAHEVEAQ